ncbi:hypothetical protein OsJ_25323 [Oryza sativa Japonica Group]|uniref:Alpha/beta hydrolase fold-3 domain-containing protein n=1 Tax=Oryza sativa subsp. japonica TaxID=39947 RepID=A3BMQ5_ORYSJ|nr:hypothetical protein OsJ_25323 [Oryza sativa Japonica Group]
MGHEKEQETAGDELRRPEPPALPWTVRLQLFALVTAVDIVQRGDGTVNRFLFSLADRQSAAAARPDAHGVRSGDVTVDAAGGNIAHHVAHRWAAATTSSSRRVRLAGVVLLQPFFGGEERTEAELRLDGVGPVVSMARADWCWRAFLPEGADRDHPAAHVTGENAELAEEFPPAMVVVGGYDTLQDWQRRYAGMLRRNGKAVQVVEYPAAIHSFYVFPELADSGELVKEMKAFMERNAPPKSNA